MGDHDLLYCRIGKGVWQPKPININTGVTMRIKPLTQRLLAVKTELSRQGISKGKQAPAAMGSFKFRGIEATMNIISKLHSENGVLVRVAHILDKDTQKDGKMVRTEACICYEFYSSDDKTDTIETWSLAEGKDSGDKVAGKVMSYGYKNAMFTFYEIPTQSQEVDSYDPRLDNEDGDAVESKPETPPVNSPSKVVSMLKGEDPGYTKDPEAETVEPHNDEAQTNGQSNQFDPDSMGEEECVKKIQKLKSEVMQSDSHDKNKIIYREAKIVRGKYLDLTGDENIPGWKEFAAATAASAKRLNAEN